MHAGVLVGPRRERRGLPSHQSCQIRGPDENRTRYMADGQDAGPYNPQKRRGPKADEAAKVCRRPSRPGPERGARAAARLRPLPGPFLLEYCPSFTNPAARRGPQIPCLFWTLFPFGHFILLFMLNKSLSEAWCHTHCVCRLLFPPHLYIYFPFFYLQGKNCKANGLEK